MEVNKIEKEIISLFVKKDRQQRILWELSSPKKREDVIWHFSGPDIFKRECLERLQVMPNVLFAEKLSQLGNTSRIYYLGESYIGDISLKQAIGKMSAGERCIIYFGYGIGYYQGERELGNYPKFILRAKTRDDLLHGNGQGDGLREP